MDDILARDRFAVILGDPGSGKTTLLRHVARTIAEETPDSGAARGSPLPILVRLPEYAAQLESEEGTDLLSHAASVCRRKSGFDPLPFLRRKAEEGRAIFLLDGLDEVLDEDRRTAVVNGISRLLREHPQSRCLIASRIVGFSRPAAFAEFEVYEIAPFSDTQVRRFIERWLHLPRRPGPGSPSAAGKGDVERIAQTILSHDSLERLARNPLTLCVLAHLHASRATLPRHRTEIYSRIADVLLVTWEKSKELDAPPPRSGICEFEPREIRWTLQALALRMQEKNVTLVPRWWVTDSIRAHLREELGRTTGVDVDRLLQALNERSGLFQERGPDRWGFSHRAFQDFFSAEAVLRDPDPVRRISRVRYHPGWREVVRLACASLDPRRVPEALRDLLDDPDATGRFLQRGLLIALECAGDGAPLYDSKLLEDMGRRVVSLGRSKWLGIGMRCIDLIGRLRDTPQWDFWRKTASEYFEAASRSLDPEDLKEVQLVYKRVFQEEGASGRDEGLDDPDLDKGIRKELQGILKGDPKTIAHVAADIQHKKDSHKELLCSILARHARSRAEVRDILIRRLEGDSSKSVRESAAEALVDALGNPDVLGALKRRLETESDPEVRGTIAWILGRPAKKDPHLREVILNLAGPGGDPRVREGAILGTARLLKDDPGLRSKIVSWLNGKDESQEVRTACVRALMGVAPEDRPVLEILIGAVGEPYPRKVRLVAAQALGEMACDGRIPWGEVPLEKIKETLSGTDAPCPHVWQTLTGILDASEIRGARPGRNEILRRRLSPITDRIAAAFVFGSAARKEQTDASDIDLFVVGRVSLMELAPLLRAAESDLAREVNAVVYSPEKLRELRRSGNTFVNAALDGPKDFLVGGTDELGSVAG